MKLLIAKNTDNKKVIIPYKNIVAIEEFSPSFTKIAATGNNYYLLKGSFEDYAKLLNSNLA